MSMQFQPCSEGISLTKSDEHLYADGQTVWQWGGQGSCGDYGHTLATLVTRLLTLVWHKTHRTDEKPEALIVVLVC